LVADPALPGVIPTRREPTATAMEGAPGDLKPAWVRMGRVTRAALRARQTISLLGLQEVFALCASGRA